jgi:hypothetical protein
MTVLEGPTDRFTVSPNAFFERVHDEGVILDNKQELYFALNESGTCVWDAVASGESVENAAQHLAERFGVDLDIARRDTYALVQDLLSRGLLKPIV